MDCLNSLREYMVRFLLLLCEFFIFGEQFLLFFFFLFNVISVNYIPMVLGFIHYVQFLIRVFRLKLYRMECINYIYMKF